MKLRPTIFLSGVSSEFESFRDAVEIEVQKKGCFAENQSSFGVDYHTVEEMLRRRINDVDAVIHIVGFRFGAEPKDRPADKPRRSYTQMEYDIARELEKPLYVFLSSDANIADTLGTDDTEATALQLAHRQAIQEDKPLYYFFRDKAELCKLAGEIDAVAHAEFRFEISRIDKYAPSELIGREDELALLNNAWLKVRRAEPKRPHVLTFVALGGEGKTSLVAKWLADLAYENWPGCDSAFAWSFYSQGTREQYASSSDLFFKEAITFLGNDADREFAASPAGAYEKGQRLARIVGQRRALLILDGLEPLQYSPTSPTRSELKDTGLLALLKGLAANSDGLCIVTTRYSIPNLKAYSQTTARELELQRLSRAAGVRLLKTLGVRGTALEFDTLVEDVKGHALTLNLLGTYLCSAHGGDIRRRDVVKLEEADAEEQGGHSFRVMAAYEEAFENEGENGKRALAILKLIGLFDRPARADCFDALLEAPAINCLSEPLVGLSEAQCNLALKRLEDAKLLTVNRELSGVLTSLDAHPLLREFFSRRLTAQQPDAWRSAHRRLYEYLCATTPDKPQPTLEDLEPLYQAVAHGCQAGLHQAVFDETYWPRILRGKLYYPGKQLGAIGVELGCVSAFFTKPWSVLSDQLTPNASYEILDGAAEYLHSLCRLRDASETATLLLKNSLTAKRLSKAAGGAILLSEISISRGLITRAIDYAIQGVELADKGHDAFHAKISRVVLGIALHYKGEYSTAVNTFYSAEAIQRKRKANERRLLSLQGCDFCELLLDWAGVSAQSKQMRIIKMTRLRAQACITKANAEKNWLALALAQLVMVRCEMAEVQRPEASVLRAWINRLDEIINQLRQINGFRFVSRAFLVRARLRFELEDPEAARSDLDEALEIVERGPLKLQKADVHLYRARFFHDKSELENARALIEQCGYWRRKEELEDAERVILKNPR